MSHASVTSVSPHSARVTEAVPARPLLVVESLDHSAGSTVQLTYTYATDAVSDGGGTPWFTFCALAAPDDASGARTAAVAGDTVAGSWI